MALKNKLSKLSIKCLGPHVVFMTRKILVVLSNKDGVQIAQFRHHRIVLVREARDKIDSVILGPALRRFALANNKVGGARQTVRTLRSGLAVLHAGPVVVERKGKVNLSTAEALDQSLASVTRTVPCVFRDGVSGDTTVSYTHLTLPTKA